MSETTTHSPESTVEAPHLRGVPEGLQLTKLDAIVGYQNELRAEFDLNHQKETDDFSAFEAQRIDEILAENGIHRNEDDPQSVHDYEIAKNIYAELIAMNKAKWLGLAEGKERTEREEFALQLSDSYKDRAEAERVSPSTPEQEEYEESAAAEREHQEAREKATMQSEVVKGLDAITKKYAEQVAERSKRMIESAKTSDDIKASREELSDLIAAVATEYMDEIQGVENRDIKWADMPEDVREEIIKTVDEFIVEQTDSVISQMEEHRMAEYNNARPVMKKFYDKWARWGEQGTKGNIKKGLVFAAPGMALGAALVPLAGVVGFGAVTGGLAVMGARSVGRRLAGAKLDKVADSRRVASEQTADIRKRASQIDQATHEDLLDIIDERTEAYRKRNLRRTAGGLAIALSVGLFTAKGADMVADGVDDWSVGKVGDWASDKFQHFFHGDEIDYEQVPDATDPIGPTEPTEPTEPTGPGIGPDSDISRGEMFDGNQGTREFTAEGQKDFNEWISKKGGYEVKPGDSVWKLSEQYLHANGNPSPTVYEVDAVKDSVLREFKANGLVDSRGWLSVGDTIKIK